MTTTAASPDDHFAQTDIYRGFVGSPHRTIKHTSYFEAYERHLSRFRGRPITLVEVGVLEGGSLFMWRDYLGPDARIVGVEMNPDAERWREDGFDVFIGDQADASFWARVFDEIGDIDVLIDDGGHANDHQIMTVACALPHVRDGGLILVEDTHASYMPSFGNPGPHSFKNFAYAVCDQIDGRSSALNGKDGANSAYARSIASVSFHESIVVFEVDRTRATASRTIDNGRASRNVQDMRYAEGAGAAGPGSTVLGRLPLPDRLRRRLDFRRHYQAERSRSEAAWRYAMSRTD